MTTYKICYALYDQAYEVRIGYYWTWKDKDLLEDSLIKFYKSISESVPMNANTIKPGDIRSGYKEFEGEHVIYRFYNGGSDRVGRPNRCVILTAWLKRIEGQTGGAPALSEGEVNKILQLPTFKKLEETAFAQAIPIPVPWILSEQFPSEAEVLKDRNDLLVKEKKESEERLQREIQELKQVNSEFAGKKIELESEIAGLRSNNSSLEEDNKKYVNRIKELRNEKEALRHLSAATQAVKPTSFPMAQINSAGSTTNTCVNRVKFAGLIPENPRHIKEIEKPVPVSYKIEIFDVSNQLRKPIHTSYITAPDENGNATLKDGIPAKLLIEQKIEVRLILQTINEEDHVDKGTSWIAFFLSYFGIPDGKSIKPEDEYIVLCPVKLTWDKKVK